MNSPASPRLRSDRAASCSPAAHPSVRLSRASTCSDSEADAHDVVQEGGRLPLCETQIGGTQLEQLTAGPQACHRERRVGAGGDGHAGVRREVVEQERHRVVDFSGLDDVIVVVRQHERPVETVEVVEQAHHDRRDHRGAVGLQECRGIHTDMGCGGLYGGDHVGQEAPRVAVLGVERKPGYAAGPGVLGRLPPGKPLAQQRCLAEPGRRADEDHARKQAGRRRQLIDEPRTRDELRRGLGICSLVPSSAISSA